jgi:hypothetical protein
MGRHIPNVYGTKLPSDLVLAAAAASTFPDSFEDATAFTANWKGSIGAAGFDRSNADHSSGSYCLIGKGNTSYSAYKDNTIETVAVGKTHTVAVKAATSASTYFLVLFCVSANNAAQYAIQFRPTQGDIRILRSGVQKKTYSSASGLDSTWRDIVIAWDGSKITWTFRSQTDNWTDPSPLAAGGVGVQITTAQANDFRIDNWRIS